MLGTILVLLLMTLLGAVLWNGLANRVSDPVVVVVEHSAPEPGGCLWLLAMLGLILLVLLLVGELQIGGADVTRSF